MPVETEATSRAYDRGQRDARLDNHAARLRRFELAQVASYILTILGFGFLALVTQRLGDKADSSAATAIALAAGLKVERDQTREALALETSKSSSKWTRTQTLAVSSSTVIAFLGYIYLTHH